MANGRAVLSSARRGLWWAMLLLRASPLLAVHVASPTLLQLPSRTATATLRPRHPHPRLSELPFIEGLMGVDPAVVADKAAQIGAELAEAAQGAAAAIAAGDSEAAVAAVSSLGPEEASAVAVPVVAAAAASASSTSLPAVPPEVLEGTMLQGRRLRRLYKASRDGWSASAFHMRCDYCGPAIVLAATGGAIFGGYNPSGWQSSDDYFMSYNAFLFVRLPNGEWERLPSLPGACSVFDYARSGPHFGTGELVIGETQAAVMGGFSGPDVESMGAQGNLRQAKSALGSSYARGPPPFELSLFGGRRTSAGLREVEVWTAE